MIRNTSTAKRAKPFFPLMLFAHAWLGMSGMTPAQTIHLTFDAVIGGAGQDIGQMTEPSGVAVDPAGNVYVADTGNHRVQQFDPHGRYIRHTGGFGTGRQQFNQPADLAATGLDVFVADTQNRRIHRFDRQLNFLGAVPNEPGLIHASDETFGFPRGIAVSPLGDVYVTDGEEEEVVKINTVGRIERRFGGFSYGQGRLHAPTGLAVDRSGRIYVADTGNDRIVVFDAFGGFVRESGRNTLSAPEGVEVDATGRVFVADTGNDRVVVLSPSGETLLTFGARGSGAGSFRNPRDLAVDQNGRLYVADTGNHRIQTFVIHHQEND